MPILTLKIAPQQSPDRHRSLARALTDLTAGTLGKRPEVTAVSIEDAPSERWFVGGAAVQRPTVLLEISVTAGTNTAAQKTAFVEQAFAELQRQLADGGQLEEASYVIVREVAETDWGYGGRSQQARRLLREQAAPSHGLVSRA